MLFLKTIIEATSVALRHKIPFALYMYPWSDEVVFFSDPECGQKDLDCRKFIVNTWGAGSQNAYSINDVADAEATLRYAKNLSSDADNKEVVSPWKETTSYKDYIDGVDELIDKLNEHGGKTVISRTICSNGYPVDWIAVANSYFEIHPEAFRYMYYTPCHGFWLGASPELLLKKSKDRFETMALAGTRPLSEASDEWSGKNIAEQAIVRDYIVDRLYDLGLSPEISKTETVTTGNIQHLRTVISGDAADMDAYDILNVLNPTPALAGYPLVAALENIVEAERHPRRCYGSYVGICDGDGSLDAFVNLRCVNFNENSWCIYVGGGIMPDSDSRDEWAETEAKSLILRKLIEDSQK